MASASVSASELEGRIVKDLKDSVNKSVKCVCLTSAGDVTVKNWTTSPTEESAEEISKFASECHDFSQTSYFKDLGITSRSGKTRYLELRACGLEIE